MKKYFIYSIIMAMGISCYTYGAPLNAELVMSGGRAWKGQLLKRDGDWVEFRSGVSARPIRLGASTIEKVNFDIKLDIDRLLKLREDRKFDILISNLKKTLTPFDDYKDIPSNLTRYRSLLMELYFLTSEYKQALIYAEQILADEFNDVDIIENAQTYQALAFIESGQFQKAEDMMNKLGWLDNLNEDSNPKQLFIGAKLMKVKEQYSNAMELISYVIAFNSQNTEWMQPAELLCAQIYIELGMLDSAEEVIRQISLLYPNTPEYDESIILKEKLVELRAIEAIEVDS